MKRNKDIDIDKAQQETIAQLRILRALKPVSADSRVRILRVLGLLLEADALIPGILRAIAAPSSASPTTTEEAKP